jgi:predicted Zn-dependent protease
LTHNEIRSAEEWIKRWLTKFPTSQDLLALKAWQLRITNKPLEAKKILTTILTKNPNHLLGLVESGTNSYNDGDTMKAKEYFKKAQIINAGWSWTKTIEAYLAKL